MQENYLEKNEAAKKDLSLIFRTFSHCHLIGICVGFIGK